MIETRRRLFGQLGDRGRGDALDERRDKAMRARRKPGMERAIGAIVAGTIGTAWRRRPSVVVVIVLGHAHGHLGADGHEHK